MICYPNPYPKLYDILPPHRDELDEILAIIFIGASRPLDEDKKRIPFVISRNRVMAALDWLKVHNPLYSDIEISQRNIDSYEDNAVPEVISYTDTESNIPDEARAANDNDTEVGVEKGVCAFSVSGVAFDSVTIENYHAVTAVAAKHMLKGKALAVPHHTQPETLWHNPNLFPRMF
ncbi:hypothetical protein AURDEDRAFT_51977, partial [Auricularia subglabra TFB-10046 SS5]